MAWPLRVGGDLLGALVVEQLPDLGRRLNISMASPINWRWRWRMRASSKPGATTTAEREMEVGRDIQASFLPESCPQAPGWEIVALWQAPARWAAISTTLFRSGRMMGASAGDRHRRRGG
jgi:hypothetical protein